jgi:Family of unknown function (DUF5677)
MSVHRLARAVTVYLARVERAFTRKGMYIRKSNSDEALAALFRQAMKTARAIVHLARSGYGSNALGLSRSMAEILLTIRWLTNRDSEARAKRFLRFDIKQGQRIIEILDKYNSNLARKRLHPKYFSRAAEYKSWDRWSDGVKRMAEEDEVLDPDAMSSMSPLFVWEVPFFIGSYHIHPTALGTRHQRLRWGETFSFHENESEGSFGYEALVATTSAIHYVALRLDLFWGLGLSEEMDAYWGKYVDPAMPLGPASRFGPIIGH